MDMKKAMTIARTHFEPELEKLGTKLNLNLSLGRGRYSQTDGNFTLEVALLDESDIAMTKTRSDHLEYAEHYGLQPENLDREITLNGEQYTISGLSTRSPKYPILVTKLSNNSEYKFTKHSNIAALKS